jgi:hypothetical protein
LQVGADEDAQHAAAIALEAKHALAAFLDPVENSGNVERLIEGGLDADLDVVEIDEDRDFSNLFLSTCPFEGTRAEAQRIRPNGRRGYSSPNILPARIDESRFVTDSPPHRLRKILRSSPLHEQIAFFERDVGIPLVEEMESAELFPVSNRARDVRDGLLALARRRGVTVLTNRVVTQDSRRPQPDGVSSGRESRQSTRMR